MAARQTLFVSGRDVIHEDGSAGILNADRTAIEWQTGPQTRLYEVTSKPLTEEDLAAAVRGMMNG